MPMYVTYITEPQVYVCYIYIYLGFIYVEPHVLILWFLGFVAQKAQNKDLFAALEAQGPTITLQKNRKKN